MTRNFIRTAAGAALLAAAGSASAEQLFGLTFDHRIITFDSANPEITITNRAVTGVAAGETLLGIDIRPATGTLYSLGSAGGVYELVPIGLNYVATLKSSLTSMGNPVTPAGSSFGIDFNPLPDRLRVVSDTNQNLRINVATGETIIDSTITSTTGAVDLLGAAYTNSFAGATVTVLYAIDATGDTLLRSTSPNAGTYTDTNAMGQLFQPLGLSFTTANGIGFDISANDGRGYLAVDSLLWEVDLSTGQASSLGIVGGGALRGLTARGFNAAVPEPATWAMLIGGFGMVGSALRRRRGVQAVSA
jgi:hypothetical protein